MSSPFSVKNFSQEITSLTPPKKSAPVDPSPSRKFHPKNFRIFPNNEYYMWTMGKLRNLVFSGAAGVHM